MKTLRSSGLGLMVGALLHGAAWIPAEARAQVVPPPSSEVPLPVPSSADTLRPRTDSVPRDTIRPAIGRLRLPGTADVGPQYRWARAELFATGALTLVDLLSRVPELTVFRTGWIASPQAVTHSGSFDRVRLFLDGVEVDAIDPRTNGLHDLSVVQIWMLDELVLERAAGELRIHMRSWGVNSTTANTRADIATGTEETDLYRAFYGKRFDNGGVLQIGAQQYGTTSPGFGSGGDALSLLSRVGIGRRIWSVDAFANRTHFSRDPQQAIDAGGTPTWDASSTFAYLRASLGARISGPYLELVAASHQLKESSPATSEEDADLVAFPLDSADTTRSRTQLVATLGFNRWGASIAITERMRQYAGERFNSLSGRADFGTRFGAVGVYAENDDERGVRLAEARGSATLWIVALSGAFSKLDADQARASVPSSTSMRGEAGMRLFGQWLYGGLVRTDTIATRAPRFFDTSYVAAAGGERTGTYFGLRGRGWRGIGADAYMTRWGIGHGYLPEVQARGELSFASNWLSRFPQGDFGINFWVAHEYRSAARFPTSNIVPEVAEPSHVLSALLEIRIMRAVLSYQVRNIMGYEHTLVPGYSMPRELQIYGVRWDFWN